MGYENEFSEPLILDIETTARDGIDDLFDVPAAPANYKDPQKILDARLDKLKTMLDRAALDIYLNQIVAIGIWTAKEGVTVALARTPGEERLHLAALAMLINNHGHRRRVVTFNGLSFDLPNVMVRADLHGLEFPQLDVTPAWRSPHTDLMEVLTYGGKFAKHSLDFYCRVYGIDPPTSDQIKALHGSDIPKLASEGRWDLIEGHCRYDVLRTALLAQRKGVVARTPQPAVELPL